MYLLLLFSLRTFGYNIHATCHVRQPTMDINQISLETKLLSSENITFNMKQI